MATAIMKQKEVPETDDVEEIISKISEESSYKRRPTQKRTRMTVPEMGKLLGLKKTDRYWLVHKNVFESKEIAGKIRINIASFEKWYANQIKYHKVTGEEPGKELKSWSYSVKEVADLLGVDEYLVYDLLKKNQMEAVIVDYWKRIPKESFQNWYKSQSRYRTKEDREKDALLEDATITMPEMAQLLGTTRSSVYTILDNPKYSHFFEFIVIAEKKRITKESFQKFLKGQDRYKLDPSNDYEELAQEQNIALANFRWKKLSQTGIRGSNGNIKYLTFDEASYLAKVSRSMINKWADTGKFTVNYFYGTEADQFSFYRIPKALFTDSYFKDLSSDAKILYGLMLDRMSLSIKNQWFDEKNRAYIYFSIEDIMELLNCGRNKAIKSMQELDDETGIGLIEKRRQGFGKVNIIYVKTFMLEKTEEKSLEEELEKFKKQTSEKNEESTEVYNSNFMKSQNQTSRSLENKLQEVYISNPNYTNLSDTEMNYNKSNQIVSADENRSDGDNPTEEYQAYENLVKETVDYESLEVTHHDDMRQVDEIVNLIIETVMCKNDKILIASNWYPASLVKKKFLMLTYSHIEYVLHCMSGNTSKVKNIKKYLLAALFNAPSTMNGYYQAEVNHDMPGLAR